MAGGAVRRIRLSWSTRSGRALVYQGAVLVVLLAAGWALWRNTAHNLAARQIRSGFAFLDQRAGFDIGEGVIAYSPDATYLRAFAAGVGNTLRVSLLGILLATPLGTLVGLGRLSRNVLVRAISTVWVEVLRNVPLVIQLFAWYLVLTQLLPDPTEPLSLAPHVWLSKGGLQLPSVTWSGGGLSLDRPELTAFGVSGGLALTPEFLALLVGLTTATSAAIAEIVRSGVLAVPKGQAEAALAVGLTHRQTIRRVVLPQALRVIVPPMTSQYLNITKNSSLAIAIGYPDLVASINVTINQTGQAIENVLIIMAAYLSVSLSISAFMNWYNKRIALRER
jgi:general L-amino acid transport system permease protein